MVDEVLDMVHHVLIMSVNPGLGAQKFIPGAPQSQTLVEVRESLDLLSESKLTAAVALDTVGDIVRAGAGLLSPATRGIRQSDIRENAKKIIGSGARRHAYAGPD